jgi:multiple sugar transport system permease protein
VIVGQRGPRHAATVLAFIAPGLVPLALFTLGPLLASVGISFLKWDLLRPPKLVGLDNYLGLLGSRDFRDALWHTLGFLVGYIPIVTAGGLVLALALHRPLRGSTLFRSAYFLPVVSSWVVVALMWRWLLSPENGLVNYLLSLVGIHGPGWWADPAWAMPSVVLATAWKDLGFVMVLLLAGLQAIPDVYYEAAEVDGAGRWARFRHVTLPLLSPTLFFVLVISLINGFQVFDQVWVMTGGGPAGATSVVVERVYTYAFRYGQMGTASAMSWVLVAIILAVTLVQFRLQRRWVNYG